MTDTAFKKTYERVGRFFTRTGYLEELGRAKNTYFERSGKVFEDDPSFEHQMSMFLEWYLFDRNLEGLSIPPIRVYYLMFGEKVEAEELESLKSMQRTVRSLCVYQGSKGNHEVFEDMVSGEVRRIEKDGSLMGLNRGDLVDLRMVSFKDEWHFCDTIQVHPRQTKDFIAKEIKKRSITKPEQLNDFLFELSHMKWKKEHYQHLSVEQVYKSSV